MYICQLICQVSVLTVGIYQKLPVATLWWVDLPKLVSLLAMRCLYQGVDLPVDLPLDLQGISSHSRNLAEIAICHFMWGRSAQVSFALGHEMSILGVDLPVDLPLDLPKLVPLLATKCLYWGVDLPLDLPGISSHRRNLSEIGICHFMGGWGIDLLVDLPPDLAKLVPLLATRCLY